MSVRTGIVGSHSLVFLCVITILTSKATMEALSIATPIHYMKWVVYLVVHNWVKYILFVLLLYVYTESSTWTISDENIAVSCYIPIRIYHSRICVSSTPSSPDMLSLSLSLSSEFLRGSNWYGWMEKLFIPHYSSSKLSLTGADSDIAIFRSYTKQVHTFKSRQDHISWRFDVTWVHSDQLRACS